MRRTIEALVIGLLLFGFLNWGWPFVQRVRYWRPEPGFECPPWKPLCQNSPKSENHPVRELHGLREGMLLVVGPKLVRADTVTLPSGVRCIYRTYDDSTHGMLKSQAKSCLMPFQAWAGAQPH